MRNERSKRVPHQGVRAAVLLTLGYTAYYFCRTNFSVGRPSQVAELAAQGWSAADATGVLGRIATVGVIVGICGKFLAGSVVGRIGARRAFLLGMLGSVLATVAFGFSRGVWALGACWAANRLVQTLGWPSAVRLIGGWFPAGRHGRVLGLVSLSWLFGDALSRAGQARLLSLGWEWRPVFFASAAALALVGLLCLVGLREAPSASADVSSADEAPAPEVSPREIFKTPAFALVCVSAFSFTLVNVTLSEWLPLYFVRAGMSPGSAALASGLFPLGGGVGAVAFGFTSDRVDTGGRQRLLIAGLLLAALCLGGFLLAPGAALAGGLVFLAGLVTGGPYAYAVGAAALDLGDRKHAATLNGVIDGVGYLGAILAGEAMARLAGALGWNGALAALALVCLLGAGVAAFLSRRPTSPRR